MDDAIRILGHKLPNGEKTYVVVFNQTGSIAKGWRIGENEIILGTEAVLAFTKEIRRSDRLTIIRRIFTLKVKHEN